MFVVMFIAEAQLVSFTKISTHSLEREKFLKFGNNE